MEQRIETLRDELQRAVDSGHIRSVEAQSLSRRLDVLIIRYTKLQQALIQRRNGTYRP